MALSTAQARLNDFSDTAPETGTDLPDGPDFAIADRFAGGDSGADLNRRLGNWLRGHAAAVSRNDAVAALVERAGQQADVLLAKGGVVSAMTGKFTGRSVKDKYIVADALTRDRVWWDNSSGCSSAQFDLLLSDMMDATSGETLYLQQLVAGRDPAYAYNVEVFTTSAWHALFIRHLLLSDTDLQGDGFPANATVLHLPDFQASPERHGVRSGTCIMLDFSRNLILICGTGFAGEIKKSIFSMFNFHAPMSGVLPMHCSANVSQDGETTLFFGLSGTGKTTLSTSADRALVGDDEHGWSNNGIFNLEDGCYAKAINLSAEGEPEIFRAAQQPGSVLENVTVDPVTRLPDYSDGSVTENTRIAYPLSAIGNRVAGGVAPSPRNIVLLTADAFGVLPPVARLSRQQAIYYFLSGYTAKLGGTERGVTEPQATFSACFGAPFMSQHPTVYGALLASRLANGDVNCWLLNTGWTGGAYGTGSRMKLLLTRRILDAALGGELDNATYRTDPIFNLDVPMQIDGVDGDVLEPILTWADKKAYREQAEKLVEMFAENFKKFGPKGRDLMCGGGASPGAPAI